MAMPLAAGAGHPASATDSGQGNFAATTFVGNGGHCGSGDDNPLYLAYDPVNHDVYVPNNQGTVATISVLSLNGACKVVGTIGLPPGSNGYNAAPVAAAFNPTNNHVYVTNSRLNQVNVIAGTKIVKNITDSAFEGPTGIAYDPGNGDIVVANGGSNTVTFISNMKVVGTTVVGFYPQFFGYDPVANRLLVSNSYSNTVTSMNASNPLDELEYITIPVGTTPEGIAFDFSNSEDYVANGQSDNVTVISGFGQQLGFVPLPSGEAPGDAVWDQSTLRVYVVDTGTANISVIQGLKVVRTIIGEAGGYFSGIAYDDTIDKVLVTEYNSGYTWVYN
jgi:DNA-binding beta-propeller fold protein YncE